MNDRPPPPAPTSAAALSLQAPPACSSLFCINRNAGRGACSELSNNLAFCELLPPPLPLASRRQLPPSTSQRFISGLVSSCRGNTNRRRTLFVASGPRGFVAALSDDSEYENWRVSASSRSAVKASSVPPARRSSTRAHAQPGAGDVPTCRVAVTRTAPHRGIAAPAKSSSDSMHASPGASGGWCMNAAAASAVHPDTSEVEGNANSPLESRSVTAVVSEASGERKSATCAAERM